MALLSVDPGCVTLNHAGRDASLERSGEVAILRLSCPPPSAWSSHKQQRFIDHLARLAARGDLAGLVILGDRLFTDQPQHVGVVRQDFHAVIEAVADCPIPVIAAVGGEASGSGLELALACAGRVASPSASFTMPDLQAGRLPVHGAIERLPRLVGLRKAAEMIIFGTRWDVQTAYCAGLVDAIAARDLSEQARSFASSTPPAMARRRGKAMNWETAAAELSEIRQKAQRPNCEHVAPLAALKALETAAQLPVRRAMLETAKVAEAFSRTDQARALAYAEGGAAALSRWESPSAREALRRRLSWALMREAVHLLDEGASPGQIDRCLIAYGFAEGPFAASDRRGLNAVFAQSSDDGTLAQPWFVYSPTLDLMVDAQRLGGQAPGWYRYRDTDPIHPLFDPEVDRLIEASATFQRMTRRPVTDNAVIERCLLAAINAAAGELENAKTRRADIIDAVWTTRIGFPSWKGGPLHQAAQIGLPHVVAQLAARHASRNTCGAPCELLVRTAARGAMLH
jgi:enoyl-CoA hydratase/carnithine racemase